MSWRLNSMGQMIEMIHLHSRVEFSSLIKNSQGDNEDVKWSKCKEWVTIINPIYI